MTPAEYCIGVCGGKCCTHPVTKQRCPRQADDGSCSIYDLRYREGHPKREEVGAYMWRGKMVVFECGTIEELISSKTLAPEIEAQCCFAHPELLLEKPNGTETPS